MKLINVIYVIILGVIEGITEWLPISSTGHLLIVEVLLKPMVDSQIFTQRFMEMFTVVVQLGAIGAVVGIFFKKIWPFAFFEEGSKQEKMALWKKILIASIPAGIIGFIFDELIEKIFFNPLTVSISLIVYGIIFILVEFFIKNGKEESLDVKQIPMRLALLIGLAQVLAMIPGTSRSGITIIAGMLLIRNRTVSTEFSFLLSIPIMIGASLLKIVKFFLNSYFIFEQLILLFIGMIVALLVSKLVIAWLLKFLKKKTFIGFGFYRIFLGLLILIGIINQIF